jgi:hypothetical protein
MDYESLCESLLPDHPVNGETIEKVKALLRFFSRHKDLPAFPQIAQPLIEQCEEAGLLVTVSNLEAVYRLHRAEFDKAVDQVPSKAWRDYIRGFEAAQTTGMPDQSAQERAYVGSHAKRVPIEQRAYSQREIDEMTASEYAERVLGIRRLNGQ